MARRRKLLVGVLCALGIGASLATCGAAAGVESEVRALSVAGLGIEGALIVIALGGALLSGPPVARRLGLLPGRLSSGRVLLLLVGTLALSHALDCLLSLSGWRQDSALADFERVMAGVRGADLALAFAAFALAPALGEELLCRGWIQRGLQPRLGGAAAVGVSSLVFGLLHVDPVHALFAFLLGLYLGTVACWSRSTWPAIACHGANNALAVLLTAGLLPGPPRDLLGAVSGTGLALLALWAARPSGATAESGPRTAGSLQEGARPDDP